MPGPQAAPRPPDAPAPLRRSRRRFILRWFWIGTLTTSLMLLLLSTAAWWAWQQRVSLINQAFHRALPQFHTQIASADASTHALTLSEITLSEANGTPPIARIRRLTWEPEWSNLTSNHIGRITLEGLHINTTATHLQDQLARLFPQSPSPTSTPASPSPTLHLAQLRLIDGHLSLKGDARTPSLSFTLDHTLEGLSLSPGSPLEIAHTDLHLHTLAIDFPDHSHLRLDRLTLAGHLSQGELRVTQFAIPHTSVQLNPDSDPHQLFALLPASTPTPPPSNPTPTTAPLPWPTAIHIDQIHLGAIHLDAAKGLPKTFHLDHWSLTGTAAYHLSGAHWTPQPSNLTLGQQQLDVTDLQLRHRTHPAQHILLPALSATLSQPAAHTPIQIQALTLTRPQISWGPAFEDLLPTTPPPTQNPPRTPTLPPLHLQHLTLHQATLNSTVTPLVPYSFSTTLTARLTDLTLTHSQLTSAAPQTLQLQSLLVTAPAPDAPLRSLSIDNLALSLIPDDVFQHGRIQSLHITSPQARLQALNPLLDPPNPQATPTPPLLSPTAPRWLHQLHFQDLTLTHGNLHAEGRIGADVTLDAQLSVTTDPPTADIPPVHRIDITALQLKAPRLRNLPLMTLDNVHIVAPMKDMLEKRTLTEVIIHGGNLEVGDDFMTAMDPGTIPSSAPLAQQPTLHPGSRLARWTSKLVQIHDFAVTLEKVAPGLPPLRFDLNLEAHDTPLQPDGLVENIAPQKIELSQLTIPSPNGALRPVARLDTIFIHFTLAGLLEKRIQRVEILSPTLYVGEQLFWYVDYYRKFVEGDILQDSDAPSLALVDTSPASVIAAAAAQTAAPTAPPAAWTVEELSVSAGKLVLAPKGVPLSGFPQPFPFSFSTRMDEGKINATFDIPEDTYTLEALDLELRGMHGKVLFNLPIQTLNNNLTETFWVDQIRWKQLHMEDAHLSVTYDDNGIYGKFGGAAYDGYLEGAFNFYLDEGYSWDGWIAATNVRSTELTAKLCPAYLLLDGVISGKAIATGNATTLYQADLEFTNNTPGQFSISALNDMLADLPPPLHGALSDQITRIGLETLRDFAYTTATGKGRFYGREGSGFLSIEGPAGSRNIEVNVYDHRLQSSPGTLPTPLATDD